MGAPTTTAPATRSRVVLSARGWGVSIGGLIALVLAFYTLNLVLILVAVFLLALLATDVLAFAGATRDFRASRMRAERVESSTLVPVDGVGFVGLELRSELRRGFYAEVFDSHADRLQVTDGLDHLVTWWGAGETQTLAYVIRPVARGQFDIGPTIVVAHDTFGFAFRVASLETRWKLEAIPRYLGGRSATPPHLRSWLVGQTALSLRGPGMEFHGLREYLPTDDARTIAWKRSAAGRLYVRQYARESQQDLVILLDVGRRMGIGSANHDALDVAVETASVVVEGCWDADVRTGLLLFADSVRRFVPPNRGPDHEFTITRALTTAQLDPSMFRLESALAYLAHHLTRATNILAFSALGGDAGRAAEALGLLRHQGSRVYLFTPEPPKMYAPLARPLDAALLASVLQPETLRAERDVDRVREIGIPVARYGREGALDEVGVLFSRFSARRSAY
jgi:uncharacterized protein (DUF58 family)